VKYAFIERHRRVCPICVQYRELGVSVSGFYQHRARRLRLACLQHLNDPALLALISTVYAGRRGAYSWPWIRRKLIKRGIRVGKQRVQRLMQKHCIRARGKRRFRVVTPTMVIDLFSRKVMSWSMRPDMYGSLVIDALEVDLFQRQPAKGI
jgi:transposase InsO family protein